jgi:hypothetical protein
MAEFTSTPGRFVQLGHQPMPAGPAADGYGSFVTVDALQAREREKIRQRLEELRPELIAKGVEVIKMKALADADAESLRKELHAAVGADGVQHAMALIQEEIKKASATSAKPASAPANAKK